MEKNRVFIWRQVKESKNNDDDEMQRRLRLLLLSTERI